MGKISGYTAITTIDDADLIPIVDVSANETKVITISQLHGSLILPILMQSDNTDQAISNTANAQIITFDTDVLSLGITRTSSSRFTIVTAGAYLISFSGVATSTVVSKIIGFWLKVNSVDVDNSLTNYTFKSEGGYAVITCTFIHVFTAGQYFEFWTWGSDTGCKWDYTAAAGSPTRPACPSIIITCNKIGQ
jgi:hypothetical protein